MRLRNVPTQRELFAPKLASTTIPPASRQETLALLAALLREAVAQDPAQETADDQNHV